MYKQYFKQAWQLMRQNRFFSLIYVLGTGLSISMVMVMAIAWHIRTAPIAPETNRDRMLYLSALEYRYDKNSSMNFYFGPRSARECLLSLQTAEAVSVSTDPSITALLFGDSYVRLPGGDNPQKVGMMATNDGFWKVFDFRFTDGKPYGEAEFRSGVTRAVISVSLAKKLYGKTDVTGQALLLNDVEYTVGGVVEDVSSVTPSVYGDLWVPYTTVASFRDAEKDQKDASSGPLVACILPAAGVSRQEVAGEVEKLVQRYNTTLQDAKLVLGMSPDTHQEHIVREFVGDSLGSHTVYITLGMLVFLFLLIPALNLSGLNASHMQDRISELGVRQAFGARRRSLFAQVLIENMVLMLPGGVVGLLFSYLLTTIFQKLLLAPGAFAIMTGAVRTELTPGMLFNLPVFFYAFLACLALNLLSSMIPVWRAVRVNITDALNK